jgi:lysylphosphatidylglycerol synthetase-like protein (DUF2156 family)
MMLEDIHKALGDIVMADTLSYWIVAALTAAMLPSKALAIVFAPGLFWGGLAGIYLANQIGFFVSTERSAQIVVTSTLGICGALLIMIAVTRLVEAAMRIRSPLTHATRAKI